MSHASEKSLMNAWVLTLMNNMLDEKRHKTYAAPRRKL
jgi:hypothetical protein